MTLVTRPFLLQPKRFPVFARFCFLHIYICIEWRDGISSIQLHKIFFCPSSQSQYPFWRMPLQLKLHACPYKLAYIKYAWDAISWAAISCLAVKVVQERPLCARRQLRLQDCHSATQVATERPFHSKQGKSVFCVVMFCFHCFACDYFRSKLAD